MDRTVVTQELIRVARLLSGMDFPNEQALKKYLKDHPDANKSKHRVVKPKSQSTKKKAPSLSGMTKGLAKQFHMKVTSGRGSGEKVLESPKMPEAAADKKEHDLRAALKKTGFKDAGHGMMETADGKYMANFERDGDASSGIRLTVNITKW